MFHITFVIISIVFSVLSTASYIQATLNGSARPNRITWLIWAVAPIIGASAQFVSGVGVSTIVILVTGLLPLCVFIASFKNPQSYWKLGAFDYVCGGFSVLALILWLLTNNPVLAIIFSILSDALAAIPTIKKCYTNPETEDRRSFVLAGCGSVSGFFSITEYTFTTSAFNLYLVAMIACILPLLYLKRRPILGSM